MATNIAIKPTYDENNNLIYVQTHVDAVLGLEEKLSNINGSSIIDNTIENNKIISLNGNKIEDKSIPLIKLEENPYLENYFIKEDDKIYTNYNTYFENGLKTKNFSLYDGSSEKILCTDGTTLDVSTLGKNYNYITEGFLEDEGTYGIKLFKKLNKLLVADDGIFLTNSLDAKIIMDEMNVRMSPNVVVDNNVTANSFTQLSDERLKTFDKEIEIDFNKLSNLRKSYFSFNKTPDKKEIGMSAQEIKEIFPEIVNEDSDGYLSVDYSKLSIIALKAIDELYKEIKKIKNKN